MQFVGASCLWVSKLPRGRQLRSMQQGGLSMIRSLPETFAALPLRGDSKSGLVPRSFRRATARAVRRYHADRGARAAARR